MGDCSSGNHYKYRVKVPRAETLFLATELADPRIVGSSRGFTVHLQDASGQTAFSLKKGRTWGCIPGLLHVRLITADSRVRVICIYSFVRITEIVSRRRRRIYRQRRARLYHTLYEIHHLRWVPCATLSHLLLVAILLLHVQGSTISGTYYYFIRVRCCKFII